MFVVGFCGAYVQLLRSPVVPSTGCNPPSRELAMLVFVQ
jgi:hypothetical protein